MFVYSVKFYESNPFESNEWPTIRAHILSYVIPFDPEVEEHVNEFASEVLNTPDTNKDIVRQIMYEDMEECAREFDQLQSAVHEGRDVNFCGWTIKTKENVKVVPSSTEPRT